MNIKTKIEKELEEIERYGAVYRVALERTGAILLTAATVFSLTALGAHSRQKQAAGVSRTVLSKSMLDSAEKNETVRMPIKFDDGLRSVAHTGE